MPPTSLPRTSREPPGKTTSRVPPGCSGRAARPQLAVSAVRLATAPCGNGFAFAARAGQTVTVTSEQMAMISADPAVMHGQAVIAGSRVPVSVILDCIAAGMTTERIIAEYPTVTAAGVRAAAAYGAALAREEQLPIPQSR